MHVEMGLGMGLGIGVHWLTSYRALSQATAKITPILQTAK